MSSPSGRDAFGIPWDWRRTVPEWHFSSADLEAWYAFAAWCDRTGVRSFPSAPEHVADYLTSLRESDRLAQALTIANLHDDIFWHDACQPADWFLRRLHSPTRLLKMPSAMRQGPMAAAQRWTVPAKSDDDLGIPWVLRRSMPDVESLAEAGDSQASSPALGWRLPFPLIDDLGAGFPAEHREHARALARARQRAIFLPECLDEAGDFDLARASSLVGYRLHVSPFRGSPGALRRT